MISIPLKASNITLIAVSKNIFITAAGERHEVRRVLQGRRCVWCDRRGCGATGHRRAAAGTKRSVVCRRGGVVVRHAHRHACGGSFTCVHHFLDAVREAFDVEVVVGENLIDLVRETDVQI